MAHFEKYGRMLFGSEGMFTLGITIEHGEMMVRTVRHEDGSVWAGIYVLEGTDLERSVRAFLAERGLVHEPGPSFSWIPDAPGYRAFDFLPASSDADSFVSLLTDMFQQVAGLRPESRLRFQYAEIV
jgi:hypothetical protein